LVWKGKIVFKILITDDKKEGLGKSWSVALTVLGFVNVVDYAIPGLRYELEKDEMMIPH
jgi:hypothetical protein